MRQHTVMRQHAASRTALKTTLGPICDEPAAAGLTGAERAGVERWRDLLWEGLEARAGRLATRDAAGWYDVLAFERWRDEQAMGGLSPRKLDFFYRLKPMIPRSLQLALRRRLIDRQGEPIFPGWPFEPAGIDLLKISVADALLERDVNAVRFPWLWPDGAEAAVALTHDVESAQGLEYAPTVAGWEEREGLRSSFNIVSEWYPLDMATIGDLTARGHEIGSHALYHDRSLFASRESFEEQLPRLLVAAEHLGAVGFRSPATHRVVDWLSELPFEYDCTMPHSDPYEPIPGGTATVWPFFHGEVVELPYTAPQDHTLFNLLGHRDATLWRSQLERIVAGNGLFQVLTHPDREYLGRPTIAHAYRELLADLAQREGLWVALPREIAAWWRRRAAGLTPREDGLARWTGSQVELAHDRSDRRPAPDRAGRSA